METKEALKYTIVVFGIVLLIICTLSFFIFTGLYLAGGIGAMIGLGLWIFVSIFIIFKIDNI